MTGLDQRAVLKLMYAALIRAAERWRGIRITEFELRQLRAIRDEIDKDFTARTAPLTSATITARRSNASDRKRRRPRLRLRSDVITVSTIFCCSPRISLWSRRDIGTAFSSDRGLARYFMSAKRQSLPRNSG